MENMGMGMGSMGMSATGDSLKNTREGRQQQQQQQQQQVSTSPTTTTGNRGRTDDKNNRKLSCKECRRRVSFFFLPWFIRLTLGLLFYYRLKLKASAILLLKPFPLKSYLNKQCGLQFPSVIVCSLVKWESFYMLKPISNRTFTFNSRVSKEAVGLSVQKVRFIFYTKNCSIYSWAANMYKGRCLDFWSWK